ncbi:glucosyl-3-phosphoglycerate synthase [Luteolibacter yonseiensis]|uniref:Glucosyl-3-phosphoglycerate synthase n=1 Tax=Luteolibacter yonseiensis TaxID=1144680 RepID=A0A934R4J9_9BACT|nr:glucosyl-3-phosphoglycerate synthase [Luteolibacter yonseiensis]MBK1816794.1 glucosyl-3-phosphoglycerate synthase [Luteolibacter yonseiensis]
MQNFHHSQFGDFPQLAGIKHSSGQRISVCIPTLDEADTIGEIVSTVRKVLQEQHPLVDEILVIDSGSRDVTREIAAAAGATVHLAADILPELECHTGKGENLWKALHVSTGDIICYVDGDISNFHPGFVTGLVGPLLTHPEIEYVKAYYERPLAYGDESHSTGGGRVSEILIRPLISLFFPELGGILQPLSGEYAARRATLESLAFPVGYGVEIAHLIDLARDGKLSNIAQTDLVKRIHRNRDDEELGGMAFALLRVILRRLERDGKISLATPLPALYQSWAVDGDGIRRSSRTIPEPERPAMNSLLETA